MLKNISKNIYEQNKEELRLGVSRAIVYGLGLRKGTNYKRNIQLHKLIDEKKSNYDDRFVAYVEMSSSIKEYLEYMFPYLNLEELDLQWTGQELQEECMRQHEVFIENTKKMEKIRMIIPKRLEEN